MPRPFRTPAPRRLVVAGIAAGAFVLAATTPAFAHNAVSASDSHALATDVTLTFNAEAESKTAGITSLRVVLPQGITVGDVTFVEGPQGWTYTPGADGFTVGGTALTPGTDAAYKIKVRQLPETTPLVFKTLQSYSDGRVDRWIDPPQGDGHDHSDTAAMPAPALVLQNATPGAVVIPPTPTSAPTSATPSTSAPATTAATTPADTGTAPPPSTTAGRQDTASDENDDDSSALPITVGVIAAVVVLGGVGAWWLRRRKGSTPS